MLYKATSYQRVQIVLSVLRTTISTTGFKNESDHDLTVMIKLQKQKCNSLSKTPKHAGEDNNES